MIIDFRKNSVEPEYKCTVYRYMHDTFDSQLKFNPNTKSNYNALATKTSLSAEILCVCENISATLINPVSSAFIHFIHLQEVVLWRTINRLNDCRCLHLLQDHWSYAKRLALSLEEQLQKAKGIIRASDQVLSREFPVKPSGRWYYMLLQKTHITIGISSFLLLSSGLAYASLPH